MFITRMLLNKQLENGMLCSGTSYDHYNLMFGKVEVEQLNKDK